MGRTSDELRMIAHRAMSLEPWPVMKYMACGRFELRGGVGLCAFGFPGPSFRFAAIVGTPSEPHPALPLDEVVALANNFFGGPDVDGGYGVLVEGDIGDPLETELNARGWTIFEDEPALVLPDLADRQVAGPSLEGFGVEKIVDEAGILRFRQLLTDGFQSPPEMAEAALPLSAATDPTMALLIGTFEGVPVSGALVNRIGPTAAIAGVATLEAYRRRGFGTAITEAAIREGLALGCTHAALRSGPMSFELYRKMGFMPVCRHRTYVRPGHGETTS